jgi:hypothetical protein
MTLTCQVTIGGDPTSASVTTIAGMLASGPCSHMSEPVGRTLLDYIITAVQPMLPSAISPVVQPESCGPVLAGVDGTGGPITCRDGRPSLAADRYFRQWHFKVLSLGPHATLSEVEAAMCYDIKHGPGGVPMDADAAQLAGAEQAWPYAPSLLGDPWKVCGV